MDIVTLGAALNGSKKYTDMALGEVEKRVSDNENDILLKANTTDVNTATANLQSQINQIAQAAGTGSADTEVAQARVDADGTTYNNLKDRLDTQDKYTQDSLNVINSNLVEIESAFGFSNSIAIDYTSNEVPQPDGTFFEDTGATQYWFGSGYVEIPEGTKKIYYRGKSFKNTKNVITPIAFYNAEYNILSSASVTDTGSITVEGVIDVPSDAKYFYQTQFYSTTEPAKNSNNYTKMYYGEKYNMDYIFQSAKEIGSSTVVYTLTDYTSTAIYLADGTSSEFENWYSTDFVDCSHHDTVTYNSYAFSKDAIDVAYIAFFDEEKTMISCLKSSDTYNGKKSGTIDVPSGAKYVRSVYASATGMTPMLRLNGTGIKKDIYDLQQIESTNLPLTYNSKICCIGDSLTQGVDVGSHIINENYPYFMSQYLNCTVLNYGHMGRTARGWWNNYKDTHTYDATIDVVLIMFGTNGGLTQNTLPTDVEPYSNPDDYADTNVGCYCKLIEKIMTDTQNHAQIILLTPPYSTYTSKQEQLVIDSEPTIRAIAKRYQLPVIDVLNECGMGKFNGNVFRPHDGCHFNAKGYHRLGTFIGSKVKSMISTFDIDEEYDDETPIGE